jgi:hypothetical protein
MVLMGTSTTLTNASLNQRNIDRELTVARKKLLCAVKRIDQPEPANFMTAGKRLCILLRHNWAVVQQGAQHCCQYVMKLFSPGKHTAILLVTNLG